MERSTLARSASSTASAWTLFRSASKAARAAFCASSGILCPQVGHTVSKVCSAASDHLARHRPIRSSRCSIRSFSFWASCVQRSRSRSAARTSASSAGLRSSTGTIWLCRCSRFSFRSAASLFSSWISSPRRLSRRAATWPRSSSRAVKSIPSSSDTVFLHSSRRAGTVSRAPFSPRRLA